MNPYEITYIIRPDLDEEQTRAAITQVNDRLETSGGEIIASYQWNPARRRMAYPINDFGDGYYVTTTFNIDSPRLREIENALKLNDRVLRFLIVQATELNIKQSQQRMQQAQAAAAAPPPQAATPPPVPAVAAQQTPEGAATEAAPAAESTAGPAEEPVETPASDSTADVEPTADVATASAPDAVEEEAVAPASAVETPEEPEPVATASSPEATTAAEE